MCAFRKYFAEFLGTMILVFVAYGTAIITGHADSGWLMTALNEEGTPVGQFIVRLVDFEKNSARLGYIVVDPAARGKGYGKKMMVKALQYAFDVLGMERVSLGVFENNPQAKACYETVGFTVKEYVPEYHVYEGVTYPAYEMEAVCHENK